MRLLCLLFLFLGSFATAQVTDNFSDGDFTSSPSWTGDAAEFIVNPAFQLQLNNTVAGASYLSTASPSSSLSNTEWRFYIRQNFAPSSSNYGRVYLASDNANLEGPLNGYYVQFGEAGSLDAVELFRQTGTTNVSVCRGTNGQIAAAFIISVKVTRDASGNWNLFVDPAAGSAYVLEASGTDNTFSTTSFFGVSAVYTISSSTKFYWDDFYNGPLVVDVTAPTIVSSTAISATQLDVVFSEDLDLATAQNTANYFADNGLGSPVSAVRDATSHNIVHLTWSSSFADGLANTLTVTSVQDLSGNAISSATTAFTYFIPVTASFKDVILTEIFADPSPQIGLPTVEFVEIYNRSLSTFNLSGWQFGDGSTTATLGSYNLGPGQYLILCNIADTALFTPFGARLGLSSFPSLNNTGDNLYLQNGGTMIDSVNFLDDWYMDAVKDDGGWSLELINPSLPAACPATNNWIASNDVSGGTPGQQNSVYSTAPDVTAPFVTGVSVIDPTHISVCFSEPIAESQLTNLSNFDIIPFIGNPVAATITPGTNCVELTMAVGMTIGNDYTLNTSSLSDCAGNNLTPASANFSYYIAQAGDVLINEIMPDPDPVLSVLPNYEYIELYNKSAFQVSMIGWTITAGTNTKVIPDAIVPADSFLVICPTAAATLFNSINVIGVPSFPSLTNSGQTLVLRDNNGTVMSSVTYSDSWYRDPGKEEGGWSLEQIDPLNPCGGADNWRASQHPDGGTPGRRNSVNSVNPDLTAPLIARISVISNDTLELFFSETLDSLQLSSAANYSIDNGVGAVTAAFPAGPLFNSVRLYVASGLSSGIIYHLTVNAPIADCAGNLLVVPATARFAIPEPVSPLDIVINEVLFDPKTGGADFVEVYNRSNKVLDLKSLRISNFDTINMIPENLEMIAEDGFLIFPGDHVVLTENPAAVMAQYTSGPASLFVQVDDLPTMSTDAGTVCLSASGIVIDRFTYDSEMHFALLDETKGVSLERIDYERPSSDRTNWHSASMASGYATPALKNSQYNDAGEAGDEIEIGTEIFSPDEDGDRDILNINYSFAQSGYVANVMIYDSRGLLVRNLVRSELLGSRGTWSWDGINNSREKERIGIYIVLVEVFDLNGDVKRYKRSCVLASKL